MGGFNTFAGGLVGRNDGTITNSSSSNTVTGHSGNGSEDMGSAIGGLAGFNSGTITGSFATGPVNGTATSNPNDSVIVGGLVGLNNPAGLIINSWSSSAVTGSGQVEFGGLVGGNFGAISQSYATGSVSSSGTRGTIGGLVGLNGGSAISEFLRDRCGHSDRRRRRRRAGRRDRQHVVDHQLLRDRRRDHDCDRRGRSLAGGLVGVNAARSPAPTRPGP